MDACVCVYGWIVDDIISKMEYKKENTVREIVV